MTKILRVFPYPLNDLTVTDGTHTITLASGLHLVQQYMVGATPKSVYQFDLEYLEDHGYISSGVLTITSTDYDGNTKQVNTSTGSSPYDAFWEDIMTYTGNSGGSGGDDPGTGGGDDLEPEEPEVNDPEGIYIDCLDEISLMANTKTALINTIVSCGGTVAEGTPFSGLPACILSIPYAAYLEDINTALSNLGITPPASYADLDTTITNSFGAILSELEDISGTSSDNPLQARITELEGYLNDIKTVLTNQGLTPPADYADLDTYINTAFNDIHNGLTNIHGES